MNRRPQRLTTSPAPYLVALVLVVAMLTGHLSDDTTLVALLTLLFPSPIRKGSP